jgi:hypothetical protein
VKFAFGKVKSEERMVKRKSKGFAFGNRKRDA